MKHVLCVAVLLLSSSAFAQEASFTHLKAGEVHRMLKSGKGVVVVDARTAQEYEEGHLPGAINIGPGRRHLTGTLLPGDKRVPVVFYCRGYG